jgi:hypothetical protein
MEEKKIISVEEMKDKIEESGSRLIWLAIEKIGYWQDRIAYRKIFFQAGGSLDIIK